MTEFGSWLVRNISRSEGNERNMEKRNIDNEWKYVKLYESIMLLS